MRKIYVTLMEQSDVTPKGLMISFLAGVVTALIVCTLFF